MEPFGVPGASPASSTTRRPARGGGAAIELRRLLYILFLSRVATEIDIIMSTLFLIQSNLKGLALYYKISLLRTYHVFLYHHLPTGLKYSSREI